MVVPSVSGGGVPDVSSLSFLFSIKNGDVSNGTWALCTNSSVDSCTKDLNLTAKLDKGLSKFKGLMMCG